jgi:mannosyltransferase OCH1-like enzyme
MINNYIHAIHFSEDRRPSQSGQPFLESWKFFHKNSHWKFRLWGVDDLDELDLEFEVRDFLYRLIELRAYAAAADILRLCILKNIGGCYVDTDMECRAPLYLWLEPTISTYSKHLIVAPEGQDGSFIGTAFLYAPPNHQLIKKALNIAIKNSTPEKAAKSPVQFTGPNVLRKALEDGDGLYFCLNYINIFPYRYIGEESFLNYHKNPEVFAVHHWEGSWKDSTPRDYKIAYIYIIMKMKQNLDCNGYRFSEESPIAFGHLRYLPHICYLIIDRLFPFFLLKVRPLLKSINLWNYLRGNSNQ